jgi:hypothetical protein
VRRLFWLSLGAAAGYYAARKSAEAVDQARERGLVGNVTLAAGTASRAAATASRSTVAIGEAMGARARGSGSPSSAGPTVPSAQLSAPAPDPTSTREARP